jgi:hypothetical protein
MHGTCEWYRCGLALDHVFAERHVYLYDGPGDCDEDED